MAYPCSEPPDRCVDPSIFGIMRASRLKLSSLGGVPSPPDISPLVTGDLAGIASTSWASCNTDAFCASFEEEKRLAFKDLLTIVGAQTHSDPSLSHHNVGNYTIANSSFNDSICSQDKIPRIFSNGVIPLLITPDRPAAPEQIFREYIPLSLSKFDPRGKLSYERSTTRSKSLCSSPLAAVSQSTDVHIDRAFLTSENSYILSHSILNSLKSNGPAFDEDYGFKNLPRCESQGARPAATSLDRSGPREHRKSPGECSNIKKSSMVSSNVQKNPTHESLILTIPVIYCPLTKVVIGVRGKFILSSNLRSSYSRKGRQRGLSSAVVPKRRKRLKLGCWTCRVRHKSCPENKPECNQCLRLNLTCDYSSNRPQYMKDPETQAKKLEEIHSITIRAKRQCDA